MSKTLAIATRRETKPRVQPRRRGATTATTLPAPHKTESRANSSVTEARVKPSTLLAVPPQVAKARPAVGSMLPSAYEKLAASMIATAENSPCRSISIFTATAGESAEEIVARLTDALAGRNLGRVQNLNGNPRFVEACRALTAEAGSSRAERTARQQIRALLDELRGECQFVLCAGGSATGPLGLLLGQLCDACYVVVELGNTSASAARQAAGGLRHSGANVLGCIVVE